MLQSGTAESRPMRRLEQRARAEAEHDAERAAHEGERGGLDQELPQHLPPGRPQRLPEADLLGPVAHRDHHDRHHPDAAHQQRDAGERHHRQEEVGGELPHHVEDLVLGDEVEVVGLAGPKSARAAEGHGHRVHRGTDVDPAPGLHRHEERVGLVVLEVLPSRQERHHAAGGLTRRLEDVGGLLVHTDDPEGDAAHPHLRSDRIEPAEEVVGDGALEHDDRLAGELRPAEQPAPQQGAALDVHVAVVRAEDHHLLRADALVLRLLKYLDPDPGVADLRHPADRLRVAALEHGTDPDLVGQAVGIHRRLGEVADDVERRGPGDLDRVEDLAPDPLDQRGDGHHRRHADHDAEDGERRAQLVGPDRVQRDRDALADVAEDHPAHSTRSAAIGSRRDARVAG